MTSAQQLGDAEQEGSEIGSLLTSVKREVKQLMEEAVTKKFIHEDSSSLTSLCCAVESCLLHGLRKRALGLFKSVTSTALLQKVSKNLDSAAHVLNTLKDVQSESESSKNGKRFSIYHAKLLWIRLALLEKELAKIVDYLVEHSSKYYEKEALIADACAGPIFASLLVGPCALDYSRMKTSDHYFSDPPADELLQRHRIHSGSPYGHRPESPKRPTLGFVRRHTSSSSEESMRVVPVAAKEYVESLHQNNKTTLLYGKNNVLVQPNEDSDEMPGYLSLHQTSDSLTIKWTPNQLMNHRSQDEMLPESDSSLLWDFAVSIDMEDIVYLHCHQLPNVGGRLVLVGQDGVQYAPIQFPRGGHLLSFLSCLESGLQPSCQLDPPLWAQRGKGKVFPKLRRRGSSMLSNMSVENCSMEEETSDYVFRIISATHYEVGSDLVMNAPGTTSSESSSCSSPFLLEPHFKTHFYHDDKKSNRRNAMQLLYSSMKTQILSRAFYGWLAHCRHLKTVRTHLSGLVMHSSMVSDVPTDGSLGISTKIWGEMCHNGVVDDGAEVFRCVYFGGIEQSLRTEVWPYLLGHYHFSSTITEREQLDTSWQCEYERIVSEWMAVEAIVHQRDKEQAAANLVKAPNPDGESGARPRKDSSLSNEVFVSIESEDAAVPGSTKVSPLVTSEKSCRDVKITSSGSITKTSPPSSSGHGPSSILVTEPTVDYAFSIAAARVDFCERVDNTLVLSPVEDIEHLHTSCDSLTSPSSNTSNGGIYSEELLDKVAMNIHRIDKDVRRCDRNFSYFTLKNLEKLRNVMCTYVWEHLDMGYVQGMCDLVAPLLVIFDDEAKTYSCFCQLMKRMSHNFPGGGSMDKHFANMRSLIQIFDTELFEHMQQNGDYTHFYFCYRWFLLDFKRELLYKDVFAVWECIWAAQYVASSHFVLFIALALVKFYRDIILDNRMDFTDIIKFFNEMAERHDTRQVMSIARQLVFQLQDMIDAKSEENGKAVPKSAATPAS